MYKTQHNKINTNNICNKPLISKMSSYGQETTRVRYVNVADPSWSIDRKIAWLKRRDYLRTHKDAFIPDNCREDKEYHHWWHTKGKFQSMIHYVDGQQPMY